MAEMTFSSQADAFARRYDKVMVPVIFRPWALELIRQAPPRAGDDVLDLACGTGAVTREVAATGVALGSLTGADMSAGMLSVARERAREAGVAANWVEALAGELPFADNSFDLCYCQQALQFFPDRPAALRDLLRVLREDGRVAMCITTGLAENPLLMAQSGALERYVGEAAGAAVRAICGLPDRDEIHALFESSGFKDVDVRRVSLTLEHPDGRAYAEGAMSGMHTGDKLSALDEAAREACFDAFLAGMGDCFDGKGIRFPHVSNLVTARA